MITALRVVLGASVLLVGCAPSGDSPLSRLSTWEAPSGEFRIRYLSPPWDLSMEDADTALFRIRSNAESAGGLEGGPGKYELDVSSAVGTVSSLMAAEVRRATGAGAMILDGPRPVQTREGVEGEELLIFEPGTPFDRNKRSAFFPLESGRVLRLAFDATPSLATAEVDSMIALVGIGPSP